MLAFQGPAQSSPTLGDALNGGYPYPEVKTTDPRLGLVAAWRIFPEKISSKRANVSNSHRERMRPSPELLLLRPAGPGCGARLPFGRGRRMLSEL